MPLQQLLLHHGNERLAGGSIQVMHAPVSLLHKSGLQVTQGWRERGVEGDGGGRRARKGERAEPLKLNATYKPAVLREEHIMHAMDALLCLSACPRPFGSILSGLRFEFYSGQGTRATPM